MTQPVPDPFSSTSLPRDDASHVHAMLESRGLYSKLVPITTLTGFYEYRQIVSLPWVCVVLRKIEDTCLSRSYELATQGRDPTRVARICVALLDEHGSEAFEAAHALGGPDAVIRLLKKSVMHDLVRRVEDAHMVRLLRLSRV